MSKKYQQFISFLCLILWLNACQPAPAKQVVPTTLSSPTASAAVTAVSTQTLPVSPSAAITVTATAADATAATARAAVLPGKAVTHTPAPEQDPTSAAIVQSLIATAQPLLLKAYASPDGLWRAETLAYPCTKVIPGEEQEYAYEILRVVRLSDQQLFTARTQLQSCGGLGAFGLGGILWSPDSHFFYFTDAREGVPDGGAMYGWYRNVFRFDTSTTQAEYLGGGPFSPDNKMLAVVRFQLEGGCHPGGLTVMDVSGPVRADYPFDVPSDKCGQSYLDWSPDGAALAYTLAICSPDGTACQSALYRVDLTTGKAERQALLENQPAQFVNVAWNCGALTHTGFTISLPASSSASPE